MAIRPEELTDEERALLSEPWYHDFEVLGLKTPQKPGIYAPNQTSKQGPLFGLIDRALAELHESGGPTRGVELFCADGFYSNFALLHGAEHMYGLDTDAHEIAKARLITRLLGNASRARFEQKDVFQLEGSFDFAICAGGLYHLSNPADLLSRLASRVRGMLVVQTVFSLAERSPTYFETPAPGWTWGCRFSYKYLLQMIEAAGWRVVDAQHNELKGNSRPEDRGSAYVLCTPQSTGGSVPVPAGPGVFTNPNLHAPPLRMESEHDQISIHGYQSFVVSANSVSPNPGDQKLLRKRDLLQPFFTPETLRGRSVLDLGASGGFFSYWARHAGAQTVTAVDMDSEYIEVLKATCSQLGFENISVRQSNVQDWSEPADIVIALALVHWIYSCSALLGSLDSVVEFLARLSRYALIIEWVDPADEAIAFFHHLDRNPEIIRGPYDVTAFEAALDHHFSRFVRLGDVSSSRSLYVAYKTTAEISLATPYPLLFDHHSIISSRILAVHDGIEYWTTVYDTGESIVKQTTADLAAREGEFLRQLDGDYFPRVYSTDSGPDYTAVTLEKVQGQPLRQAVASPSSSPKAFLEFSQHCLNILSHLAKHGIVHRDIRFDNVLLRNGKPVLIDFGWAVSERESWISPEALGGLGRPPDDSFSDLYSMGKLLQGVNSQRFPAFSTVLSLMTAPDPRMRITDISALYPLFWSCLRDRRTEAA